MEVGESADKQSSSRAGVLGSRDVSWKESRHEARQEVTEA